LGWTSNCSASWASVRSPLRAASATFALKAGVWFRRVRLLIVSPDSRGTACPLSGRNSTYRPVQILEAGSLRVWNDELFLSCGLSAPKCSWEIEARPSDGPRKACDFHAISTVGSGNKYRDPSLIGRFGIGFVSVYQITDTPMIRSLGVQLELDPLRERNRVTYIND